MKKMLCTLATLLLIVTSICPISAVGQTKAADAKAVSIVFTFPDVSKKMNDLQWSMPELKAWKQNPTAKVNGGKDGVFNLTAKVNPIQQNMIGVMPRLAVCPFPNEPDRCWDQEVLTPINQDGIFTCKVYLRLNISVKHVFKFSINNDVFKIVIDEKNPVLPPQAEMR
jgi:hypothetical protein